MKVGWPSLITRSWSTLPWMNDLMIAGMMALAAATKDKDDAAACLKVNRPTSEGNSSVRFFGLSSTLEKWVALYSEMKCSRGTSVHNECQKSGIPSCCACHCQPLATWTWCDGNWGESFQNGQTNLVLKRVNHKSIYIYIWIAQIHLSWIRWIIESIHQSRNWIELHLTHLRHKFQWHWECGQVRWLSSHLPPCCYYCKAMEALSFVARCCRCYLDWWGDLAASWSKPTEMGASIVPLNWSMHVHVHETIVPYLSIFLIWFWWVWWAIWSFRGSHLPNLLVNELFECFLRRSAAKTTHRVMRGTWGHSKQVVAGLMSEGVVVQWVQKPTSQH